MSLYVVATKPQLERRAQRDILRAGVPAYAPCVTRWRRARGTKVRTRWPLLPGYVFVATEDLGVALPAIHASPYVTGLIGFQGRPARIGEAWLARILVIECFGCFDYTRDRKPKMSVGQMVRIVGGQFQGVLAKVTGERSGKMVIEIGTGLFQGPTLVNRADLVAA